MFLQQQIFLQELRKPLLHFWAKGIGSVFLLVRSDPARNNISGVHFVDRNVRDLRNTPLPHLFDLEGIEISYKVACPDPAKKTGDFLMRLTR